MNLTPDILRINEIDSAQLTLFMDEISRCPKIAVRSFEFSQENGLSISFQKLTPSTLNMMSYGSANFSVLFDDKSIGSTLSASTISEKFESFQNSNLYKFVMQAVAIETDYVSYDFAQYTGGPIKSGGHRAYKGAYTDILRIGDNDYGLNRESLTFGKINEGTALRDPYAEYYWMHDWNFIIRDNDDIIFGVDEPFVGAFPLGFFPNTELSTDDPYDNNDVLSDSASGPPRITFDYLLDFSHIYSESVPWVSTYPKVTGYYVLDDAHVVLDLSYTNIFVLIDVQSEKAMAINKPELENYRVSDITKLNDDFFIVLGNGRLDVFGFDGEPISEAIKLNNPNTDSHIFKLRDNLIGIIEGSHHENDLGSYQIVDVLNQVVGDVRANNIKINANWLTSDQLSENLFYSSEPNFQARADLYWVNNISDGNDTLFGNDENNTIESLKGNDRIAAGDGNDTLDGGAGDDILYGGNGLDIFKFSAAHGRDIIKDFDVFEDEFIYLGSNTNSALWKKTLNSGGHDLIVFEKNDPTNQLIVESGYSGDGLNFKLQKIATIELNDDNSRVTLSVNDTGKATAHQAEFNSVSVDGITSFKTNLKKASDESVSDPINLSDVLAQLKHIIGLNELKANALHAGDSNNDGTVNLSDVLANLKHIIGLKEIDTFDLVTDNGFAINSLNADSAGNLTLVINGDADQSHADWDFFV